MEKDLAFHPHSVEQIVLVISNASSQTQAKRIAHVAVEEGLAACVNMGAPSLSIYEWGGELKSAEEIQLTFKTTGARVMELMKRIKALHSDEVPEILVVPVIAGLEEYVDWVKTETAAK